MPHRRTSSQSPSPQTQSEQTPSPQAPGNANRRTPNKSDCSTARPHRPPTRIRNVESVRSPINPTPPQYANQPTSSGFDARRARTRVMNEYPNGRSESGDKERGQDHDELRYRPQSRRAGHREPNALKSSPKHQRHSPRKGKRATLLCYTRTSSDLFLSYSLTHLSPPEGPAQ